MARYFFDLWRDVVYAIRMLARAPGFTAVGILSLTLGIGVCSVFYSEINSMVLRPLPAARHPEALVALETLSSYPYFERYRDRSDSSNSQNRERSYRPPSKSPEFLSRSVSAMMPRIWMSARLPR